MTTYKGQLPELSLNYKSGEVKRTKIASSKDAKGVFMELFNQGTIEYSEEFVMMLLNKANNTIGFMRVSTGGMSATIVDPKMIFSTALLAGATAMIVAHNHPSGNTQPSEADKRLTNKIVDAGKLLDIQVLDHLIITSDNYFSFADEGLIKS